MPKKNPKTKNKISSKLLILITLILVSTLIITPFAISKYQQYILENKFKVLEKEIDELTDTLNKELPGKKFIKDRYCYQENIKYGEAPLKCTIEIKSTELLETSEMEKTAIELRNNKNWSETKKANISKLPSSTINKYKDPNFFCSADYFRGKSLSGEEILGEFMFHCSSVSKQQIYQYKN